MCLFEWPANGIVASGAGRRGWAPANSDSLHGGDGGDGGVCVHVHAHACARVCALAYACVRACLMCLQYPIKYLTQADNDNNLIDYPIFRTHKTH